MQKNTEKLIIYNLFPTLAGQFTRWEAHLQRAADMGFNWIFVNPIQQTGYSGSLYSIADYFALNPLLIDKHADQTPELQVKMVTKVAKTLGLNVMVDLVINHCASDSILITEHPEWFNWEGEHVMRACCYEEGQKIVWEDLAQFNHRNTKDKEGLFQYFLKVVDFLVELGFIGFRCDAAYQVPREFWQRLIRETKAKHPETIFIAETLGCTADQTRKTAEAGFDYIFNSSKWWDFNGAWLMEQYNLTRELVPSISFPESHDTPRLMQEFYDNANILKQRYLFAAIFSSGLMMPMGYEFGFKNKLHVVHTRPKDWEETAIDLQEFIRKVNAIKSKCRIFQEDSPIHLLHNDNPQLLVMWKGSTRTQEEALIILNKDGWNRQTFYAEHLRNYVQAGAPLIDVSPEYPMTFIPQPFVYELNPGQGLIMVTQRDVIQ
jgi:starch synthase (maltosyl-transferring)